MMINQINSHGGGINVNELFDTCLTNLNNVGVQLQEKMERISEMPQDQQQTAMLEMQFYIGQYNAILEMVSSVSKSLTDMMKTLAQRTS